jgi:hypothetical protein
MVWGTLAVPERPLLIIETREVENFQVAFSALDYQTKEFLWKDWKLPEPWWIGLTAARGGILLLQRYTTQGNPDRKNLLACDIFKQEILWEVPEFSFYDWDETYIWGHRTREDMVPARVAIKTGEITEEPFTSPEVKKKPNAGKPAQYLAGTPHFDTVQKFILSQTHQTIVQGVEYLEHGDWIVVSAYRTEEGSLANYLLVFNGNGKLVLQEKLAERLAGLGVDTFFILSGCLFFVKNKSELVAYRLYD